MKNQSKNIMRQSITKNKAYKEILSELNKRQKDVIQTLMKCGASTCRQIAAILNTDMHSITPRILELREYNLVEIVGTTIDQKTHIEVNIYDITSFNAEKLLSIKKLKEDKKNNIKQLKLNF